MSKITLNEIEYDLRPLRTGAMRKHAEDLAENVKLLGGDDISKQALAAARMISIRADAIKASLVCDDPASVVDDLLQGDFDDAYLAVMGASRGARSSDPHPAPAEALR